MRMAPTNYPTKVPFAIGNSTVDVDVALLLKEFATKKSVRSWWRTRSARTLLPSEHSFVIGGTVIPHYEARRTERLALNSNDSNAYPMRRRFFSRESSLDEWYIS